jgi:hypothetical protein
MFSVNEVAMTKYSVQFDPTNSTYMVLEHVFGQEVGQRVWDIVDEYDTEEEAQSVCAMLVQADSQEIYAEFG